ncbi:hypothetical protein GCM10028808_10440 [Spirosoma migulaei]
MATSFAQVQFGKPINEVKKQDLIDYFSVERDETLTLEFKSFVQREGDIKHKESGVLRTICGFLNSTGGLLIWGAPIGTKNGDGHKVFVGSLSPVERLYSKDDFIRMLSGRIVPFAAPVKVESIEVESGKYVYLIDVPESEAKPHQFDNSYYMRLDGQTKFAPHYIIDALFKQIKQPELRGFLRIVSYKYEISNPNFQSRVRLELEASIFNESKNINDKDVYIQIISSKGVFIPNDSKIYFFGQKGSVFVKDDSPVITYILTPQFSFNLEIASQELSDLMTEEQPLEISIVFGSSKSVTRRSDYFVIFKNVQYHEIADKLFTLPRHLSSLMEIRKEENISLNEQEFGTEEERRQNSLRGI